MKRMAIQEDLQVEATTAMQRASVPAGELNPELARQVQALQDLIRKERRNGFRAAADVWAQCGEFFEDDKQIDSAVEIYLDDSKRMDDAQGGPLPPSGVLKSQGGFIDIDFGALFFALIVIGAVLGATGLVVVQWLWPIVKQFIHMVTA